MLHQPFKNTQSMIFLRYFILCIGVLVALNNMIVGQNANDRLKDIRFIATADNTSQYYVELLPERFDNKNEYDIIIGLHGHGADRWQFATDKRSECIAFRNFAANYQMIAISPDYRARTSWMGPAAEKDMIQIISELKRRHRVNRVFLIGGSMDGASALTFAALHPELIDGAVAMNGHANHFEFEHFQEAISASFGGNKKTVPEEYKKRSPEYWPEKLTMPVAFTVGRKDTIVPPASVIRLAKVLQTFERSVLLNVDEAGGHETNYKDAYNAMEFILKKVKAK